MSITNKLNEKLNSWYINKVLKNIQSFINSTVNHDYYMRKFFRDSNINFDHIVFAEDLLNHFDVDKVIQFNEYINKNASGGTMDAIDKKRIIAEMMKLAEEPDAPADTSSEAPSDIKDAPVSPESGDASDTGGDAGGDSGEDMEGDFSDTLDALPGDAPMPSGGGGGLPSGGGMPSGGGAPIGGIPGGGAPATPAQPSTEDLTKVVEELKDKINKFIKEQQQDDIREATNDRIDAETGKKDLFLVDNNDSMGGGDV